jgi:hypothetical protein
MKFRWSSIAALLTLTLVSAAQAADEWKTYRYPEFGFVAEYPTPPDPQKPQIDPKRLIRNAQYWSDKGDVAYGVNAALFHHSVITSLPPDKQIQNVLEGVRGSLKCSIRSQRPITFPGGIAREIVFEKCPAPLVDAKQRILIVGDWLYQLLVLGSKAGVPESPDTKRFLESFSVVAQ